MRIFSCVVVCRRRKGVAVVVVHLSEELTVEGEVLYRTAPLLPPAPHQPAPCDAVRRCNTVESVSHA